MKKFLGDFSIGVITTTTVIVALDPEFASRFCTNEPTKQSKFILLIIIGAVGILSASVLAFKNRQRS